MAEFRREEPTHFAWREAPYEYEHHKQPIDILSGSDRLRTTLDSGMGVEALVTSWRKDEDAFAGTREKFLLYR
jgi:uncharacterized protein YbbC (DUF1343 family)